MFTSYQYRKVTETLAQSLANFETVDTLLFRAGEEPDPNTLDLKSRWQTVLTNGHELAEYVKDHHRVQAPAVLTSLEELAKYTDVTRPFRLSIIGQKGVGKSALVNALLGASKVQYTPSEVAGKAVSGTRIRLMAGEEGTPTWRIVFLSPRRLWEIGSHLLVVARMTVPTPPKNLNRRESVLLTLKEALATEKTGELEINSTLQIQARSARDTLTRMLEVYRQAENLIPADFRLELDDPDVDGPISPYLRQTPEGLHLIVDYVERFIPAEEAGVLAGRRIELEDVLGLDDPRDSFFALEAFRESFAVVMVFKCDRGLNTESSSLLEYLFKRDEEELAHFGNPADLNKAIIVANQFDGVAANITVESKANPLKGIEDLRRDLARYTKRAVPIYLTSAEMARNARLVLENPQARPSAAYSSYLTSLTNLLEVVVETENSTPDYLDFIMAKRTKLEDIQNRTGEAQAQLVLELSGLPRLIAKVTEALEAGSILRGRVANAEYYYASAISETARCYARRMREYGLEIDEFNQPSGNLESRLFSKFQHEMQQKLEEADRELRKAYFSFAQSYIHGPLPRQAEENRENFLKTIREALTKNRDLIQTQPHISTGEMVTDAWRKIFEDLNDWLALEAGRQTRRLVGPLVLEIERLAGSLEKRLAELGVSTPTEGFWQNYRERLARLRERLQMQAEMLGIAYYTDYRFSVYDLGIAEALHVGEPIERRERVVRQMQERVMTWYNQLWHLLAKVTMTELNTFVSEIRYYILGLPAEGSLLAGLQVSGKEGGELAPVESLVAALAQRYHTDEHYRRQYQLREPSPAERLTAEIRDWLDLVRPPLVGLVELGKALASVGTTSESEVGTGREEESETEEDEDQTNPISTPTPGTNSTWAAASSHTTTNGFTRLKVPVESLHPYRSVTKQVWEISNPDKEASATRLHFSRIDLSGPNDRIVVESLGKKEQQVITGHQQELWTRAFSGQMVVVHFIAENSAKPGWGFVLDGLETVAPVAAR